MMIIMIIKTVYNYNEKNNSNNYIFIRSLPNGGGGGNLIMQYFPKLLKRLTEKWES